MTKVLFWNLRNFTLTRLAQLQAKAPAMMPNPLAYFEQAFALTDILVLIEECHRGYKTKFPTIAQGKGAQGVVDLYNYITKVFPADNWYLVPPVITGRGGKAEAIAVYYKGVNLQFTGPWNANLNITSPAVVNAYDPAAAIDWNFCLPPVSQLKGGQWQFHDFIGNAVEFMPGGKYREPWLVTFDELGGAKRSLQIVGVHSPAPNSGGVVFGVGKDASQYLNYMSNLNEIVKNPYGVAMSVVGGDFNIDSSLIGGQFQYNFFAGAIAYEWGFKNTLNAAYPQQVYPNTSLRNTARLPVNFLNANYPNSIFGSSVYDHIFASGGPGTINKQMVLNPVIGVDSPLFGGLGTYGFTNVWPNAPGYTKGWNFPTVMNQDIPTIVAPPGMTVIKSVNIFKNWINYGHIYFTSDHMGVVGEV